MAGTFDHQPGGADPFGWESVSVARRGTPLISESVMRPDLSGSNLAHMKDLLMW